MQVKELKALIKECVLEVLTENLLEGFDPTSAGPNPAAATETQYNPYPQWNAEMRKMEEDSFQPLQSNGPTVNFELVKTAIQRAQFDKTRAAEFLEQRSLGKPEYKVAADYLRNASNNDIKSLFVSIRETDPHGRYAQDAGAGQFDPKTFGNLPTGETMVDHPIF